MISLSIIAELDGKIKEKKPLQLILKKKNEEELEEFSDYLYELYIPEWSSLHWKHHSKVYDFIFPD